MECILADVKEMMNPKEKETTFKPPLQLPSDKDFLGELGIKEDDDAP